MPLALHTSICLRKVAPRRRMASSQKVGPGQPQPALQPTVFQRAQPRAQLRTLQFWQISGLYWKARGRAARYHVGPIWPGHGASQGRPGQHGIGACHRPQPPAQSSVGFVVPRRFGNCQ